MFFLPFFLYSEKALLDGSVRNSLHEITECDTRLHLSLESHEDRFGHVERHNSCSRSEGDETRSSRERNANRESSMRITTSTNRIRHKHAIEPGMNNAVSRSERNAASSTDEIG